MTTCQSCSQQFTITTAEKSHLTKMAFTFGTTKIDLPEPTNCPDCRSQIRTAHRNEQYLYQRKSDLSGKQIISVYTPEPPSGKPYKIYSTEEWNSDSWDALDYGRDFDFSRPFFEQFVELQKDVPRITLVAVGNENSPYTTGTGTGYCKNCHLINSSEYCEDCYYGKLLQSCKDSVDCSYLYDSELCYENFSCYNCYNSIHLSYSQNSVDCHFSENLTGCKNCFLSTGLQNKEYYFRNKPVSKEDYETKIHQILGSHANFEKAKEILTRLKKERIHKYANITNSENCSGDFIKNSRNCHNCYDLNDSQDNLNVWVGVQIKDCIDCSNMYIKPELSYQFMGSIGTYHVAFSIYIFHSQDILYSEHIHNSKNLFGCAGLKNKSYCIFNKQYTKEEYETLVPKIIEHMKKTGEWGQFFPAEISPHAYNESLSSEYYPLSKEEVLRRGWHWHEEAQTAQYQGPTYQIPDNIKDTPKEITQKILTCEKSSKLYKIIPQELRFYQKLNIPVPHLCPDQRHFDRMSQRNPRFLYPRQCQKCQTQVQSTFAPNRPEKIYCEKCYLNYTY